MHDQLRAPRSGSDLSASPSSEQCAASKLSPVPLRVQELQQLHFNYMQLEGQKGEKGPPFLEGLILLLTSHWPEPSHMAKPSCKDSWEM